MKKISFSFFHKTQCIVFLTLFSVLSGNAFAQKNEATVFDTILSQIRTAHFHQANEKMVNSVDSFLTILNKDGSFNDIDYTNTHRTLWTPQVHLTRLNSMVNTYISTGNRYYKSDTVYNSIVRALQFWQIQKPKSSNWWHNQIAVPQTMGILLIGMRVGFKQIPEELEKSILSHLKLTGGDSKKQTGANKVDVAIHSLYRSCLERNAENLKIAVDESFFSLVQTNKEGIQQDWCYFQHGQQLYIGGYGKVLIDGVVNVAQYLTHTPYALAGQKLEILSTFVRETYLNSIRGQHHLFNVLGRGMTRKGSMTLTGFASTLSILKTIDSQHAPEYEEAIQRIKALKPANYAVKAQNKHYWRGDYTLHQRPAYSFDVRMVSTRTARNENGNEENLKGYFLSDGGTDIALEGDEYASILPVWDWTKIPGTTAPALPIIPMPNSWSELGKSNFAGGVSDGLYGASGYGMTDRDFDVNTFANKSWFFFDKEVVCLGAGIHSTASETIHTTVNQCALKGKVAVSIQGNRSTQNNGITHYTNPDWVWHNKIAYFFPQASELSVTNRSQSGSWYDINKTQSKEMVNKEVFSLWFDHGTQPLAARYAYIVVPNVDNASKVNRQLIADIEILANSDSVQAVHHKALGIYSFIFFHKATFSKNNILIKANKGCALLMKEIDKQEVKVFVADPAQDTTAIQLHLKFPAIAKTRELVCEKLTFPFNGATRRYLINNKTPLSTVK